VTAIEIKSGYGLTTEDELRMLRAARRLDESDVVRVSSSFLGAHTIPPEYKHDRESYVESIIREMIPEVARHGLASACDAYIDEGAFTIAEATRILGAARAAGLAVRGHVGQFRDLGGAELLAKLGALSADHLECLDDRGAAALGQSHTVAVLLPCAWRTLRQTPPDVGRLRRAGVAMAVGTDCNPGTSPCTDLPLCAALAVRDAGLTVEEALLAVTVNAARAAGLRDSGRVVRGGVADLAIYDFDDPRILAYAVGGTRAQSVVLRGRLVFETGTAGGSIW
jgi:imidazolonepropionase